MPIFWHLIQSFIDVTSKYCKRSRPKPSLFSGNERKGQGTWISTVLSYIRSVYSYVASSTAYTNYIGAVLLLHLAFISGCPLIVMSRFDPVLFCAYVERYKATIALIVPPVLVVLARHPGM